MRFFMLVLILLGTAVAVTIAMFQTLYTCWDRNKAGQPLRPTPIIRP